jgi:hypothetical protein
MFEHAFPEESVAVAAYGNVMTAVSFLHGISVGELRKSELEHHDPDYQVIISVRAEKPRESS